MIDLNEFKKSVVRVKSSHLINVFISDFDEIIDRAIAAESEVELKENEIHKLVLRTAYAENKLAECLNERDELKAKLAQFERELPKTPEGFPELDKEHLIKICIDQQAKLAEIEAQEPAIEYFMDGGFPNARFNGYQPKPGDKLYLQPIANNSETVQRITEQDVRAIANIYYKFRRNRSSNNIGSCFDDFFKAEGRTLIAKLNESREPIDIGNLWHLKHSEDDLIESENIQVLHSAVFNLFEDIRCLKETISDLQVTSNKAEVPTHYYARDSNVWWYRKTENEMYYWDLTDEDNCVYGWKKHTQGGDVNHDKWLKENLKPLPPLKDE